MRRTLIPTVIVLSLLFGSARVTTTGAGPYRAPSVRPVIGQTFSFLVVGDYGIGNAEEGWVAEAMRAWYRDHGVDAFVTAGDNVYPEAEPEFFADAWERPFGWVDTAGLPVLPSLGNHDVEDGSSEAVMDYFGMPGAWYARTFGDALVVVLDSNQVGDPAQSRWLTHTLKRAAARWTIVVVHKPPYACGRYDGTPEVEAAWAPLFARYGVDLVVSGHDHNYQRFAPLHGVTYVVTGGGGDSFYSLPDECAAGTPARVAANDTLHHFLVLRGSPQELSAIAIATDGTIVDRFLLR